MTYDLLSHADAISTCIRIHHKGNRYDIDTEALQIPRGLHEGLNIYRSDLGSISAVHTYIISIFFMQCRQYETP